jgi:hypothetical protein
LPVSPVAVGVHRHCERRRREAISPLALPRLPPATLPSPVVASPRPCHCGTCPASQATCDARTPAPQATCPASGAALGERRGGAVGCGGSVSDEAIPTLARKHPPPLPLGALAPVTASPSFCHCLRPPSAAQLCSLALAARAGGAGGAADSAGEQSPPSPENTARPRAPRPQTRPLPRVPRSSRMSRFEPLPFSRAVL